MPSRRESGQKPYRLRNKEVFLDRFLGDRITIVELTIRCIIGIFGWEREVPQTVTVDLDLPCDAGAAASSDRIADALDYKQVSKMVTAFVASSRFCLIETLAEKIAEFCLIQFGVSDVGVCVRKPGALREAKDVGVIIRRSTEDLKQKPGRAAYLGLGSNIEPEVNMPRALNVLHERFTVTKTSQTYRTKPHGMDAEEPFWNLAVEIRTELTQEELKHVLSKIEEDLGRLRTDDKYASRTMDIDILVYDGMFIHAKDAHGLSLADQGFTFVPLTEIAPRLNDPVTGKTLIELLSGKAYKDQFIESLAADQKARTLSLPLDG